MTAATEYAHRIADRALEDFHALVEATTNPGDLQILERLVGDLRHDLGHVGQRIQIARARADLQSLPGIDA